MNAFNEIYTLVYSNNILTISSTNGISTEYDLALFSAIVTEDKAILILQEIATDKVHAYIHYNDLIKVDGVANMLEMAYHIGLIAPPVDEPQAVTVDNFPSTQDVSIANESIVIYKGLCDRYSVNYYDKTFDIPSASVRYGLFLFRAKALVVDNILLEEIIASVQTYTNVSGTPAEYLLELVVNPVITETIEEDYWQDLNPDSELEYLRPKITGLTSHASTPTTFTVTDYDKVVYSRYVKAEENVSEQIYDKLGLPTDQSITVAFCITAFTGDCNVRASLTFEKHI